MNTQIKYGASEDGWLGFERFLWKLIQDHAITSVCEVGGGANPILNRDRISREGIEYAVLDVSATELEKAPAGYQKILADIGSRDFHFKNRFNLVFSRMLAEHIRDAEQFHKNVLDLLKPGGFAVHFFPTLYAFPYVVNRLVPERFSRALLKGFGPRDEYKHAKFPAYYRWCRGPIKNQIRKFSDLGFDVVEYVGYFGHEGYYRKAGFLKNLHRIKTRYLLKNPNPYLTSYAYIVARKPK